MAPGASQDRVPSPPAHPKIGCHGPGEAGTMLCVPPTRAPGSTIAPTCRREHGPSLREGPGHPSRATADPARLRGCHRPRRIPRSGAMAPAPAWTRSRRDTRRYRPRQTCPSPPARNPRQRRRRRRCSGSSGGICTRLARTISRRRPPRQRHVAAGRVAKAVDTPAGGCMIRACRGSGSDRSRDNPSRGAALLFSTGAS